LEHLVKRNNDEEENNEEESDGERIEEARNLLDKLEDLRRNPKYGNETEKFVFVSI